MLGLIVTNTTYALTEISWEENYVNEENNEETNINSEWRFGLSAGNRNGNNSFGAEIEYLGTNFSLYGNSRLTRDDSNQFEESIVRLGSRYYKDKNNGFFGDLSLIVKREDLDDPEEEKMGFGISGGYVYQLSNSNFIILDSGYSRIDGDSEFHLKGGLSFSWSNFIARLRRREQEEKAREETEKLRRLQSFLNRHPNITEEAKEYLRNNPDELEDDRINYIDDNSNLNGEVKSKIILKEIWIGMKDEKLEVIKGKPRDINRTTTAYGVREQWVYGAVGNRKYYYFENGILTTIQD